MTTLQSFDIATYRAYADKGFCTGVGNPEEQVCVEAAFCLAMGEPIGDEHPCVGSHVRCFIIALNDSAQWASPASRAAGLFDLGIAQFGSASLDQTAFAKRLAELTIRELIPALFREVFPNNPACLAAADRCEKEGTRAHAALAALAYANATHAANANANAAATYATDEKYLILSASLAVRVLREMNCEGIALLDKIKGAA